MVNNLPLVSVICLCYNHSEFLNNALKSVFNQNYPNIEIIVLDDYSSDNSFEILQNIKTQNPSIVLHRNQENLGNCKTFNIGLSLAKGKYIIDFATDDIMLPNRITRQVAFFESLGEQVGMIYHNAELINSSGNLLRIHDHKIGPSGNLFKEVLEKYFICPPTMMMRKSLLDNLGGYNESLAYEDFDFWIRASLISEFYYQNEILTQKRISDNSLSNQFIHNDALLKSTAMVCNYALPYCQTNELKKAISKRVAYEIRFLIRNKKINLITEYEVVLNKLKKHIFPYYLLMLFLKQVF